MHYDDRNTVYNQRGTDMKFVIGGAYQGKLRFAKKLAGITEEQKAADGKTVPLHELWRYPVINGFHLCVKRLLEDGMESKDKRYPGAEEHFQEVKDFIRELLDKNPEAVIVMNEVGYGIVPVKAEERACREAVGMAGQMLAENAEEMYRVVCGIAQRLK